MGGIIFKQANQPGGGGTVTGATNGLQPIGTDVGLGGVLDLMTTIVTSNSSTLRFVPSSGEQNALLVVGATTGYENSAFFNVIGDFYGAFQQKAIFISDKTVASLGDGFEIYYDNINDALQIGSTNNSASFNITNANVVVGNNISTGAALELHKPFTGIQLIIFDDDTGDKLEINYNAGAPLVRFIPTTANTIFEFDGMIQAVSPNPATQPQLQLTDSSIPDSATLTYDGSYGSVLFDRSINVGDGNISTFGSTKPIFFGNSAILGITNASQPQFGVELLGAGGVFVSFFLLDSTLGYYALLLQATPFNVRYQFSGTEGIVFPKVTQAQRLAISNPEVGQVVFQTNGTEGLYLYKSTGWALLL